MSILTPDSNVPGAPVRTRHPDHQPRVPTTAGEPPFCSCGWEQPDPQQGLLADHLREMEAAWDATHTPTRPNTKHPAKFSDPILQVLQRLVRKEQKRLGRHVWVVDPFAGVGRIHQLATRNISTRGLEIEPEWAACHCDTICVDAHEWLADHPWIPFLDTCDLSAHPQPANGVDLFVTSPDYGNRLADHHEAKDGSERRSYRHDLGRMPTEGSTSVLHWGPDYWGARAMGYRMMLNALRPGGMLILNVKDIVRGQQLVPAAMWHHGACIGAGFEPVPRGTVRVPVKGLRYGANHGHHAEPGEETRADHEVVFQFRRPAWNAA